MSVVGGRVFSSTTSLRRKMVARVRAAARARVSVTTNRTTLGNTVPPLPLRRAAQHASPCYTKQNKNARPQTNMPEAVAK